LVHGWQPEERPTAENSKGLQKLPLQVEKGGRTISWPDGWRLSPEKKAAIEPKGSEPRPEVRREER